MNIKRAFHNPSSCFECHLAFYVAADTPTVESLQINAANEEIEPKKVDASPPAYSEMALE